MLDLLALAGAVDKAGNAQQAKDGVIGAGMRLRQTFPGLVGGIGRGVPDIAVTRGSDVSGQQGKAQLQQLGEQATLDLIEAQVLLGGLLDEGEKGLELLLRLEKSPFLRHDHGVAPWGRHRGWYFDVVPLGAILDTPCSP
jgi:hypothetical protein